MNFKYYGSKAGNVLGMLFWHLLAPAVMAICVGCLIVFVLFVLGVILQFLGEVTAMWVTTLFPTMENFSWSHGCGTLFILIVLLVAISPTIKRSK